MAFDVHNVSTDYSEKPELRKNLVDVHIKFSLKKNLDTSTWKENIVTTQIQHFSAIIRRNNQTAYNS